MIELSLDHFVHTVQNPEEAAKDFRQRYDWTPVAGGRHERMGTFNWLHYFDLSYVEWVAVFSEDIAENSEFGRWVLHDWKKTEGVSQFVLRTTAMDAIVDLWQKKGLAFTGPVEASRRRPDGSVLAWRMLFPHRQNGETYPLPFVIEWSEDDEERKQGLVERGALPPSGESRVQLFAIHSAVHSVQTTLERWYEYFPFMEPAEPVEGALGQGMCIWNEGVAFCFWPIQSSDELRSQVERVGERPFQIDVIARGEDVKWTIDEKVQRLKETQAEGNVIHGLRIRNL